MALPVTVLVVDDQEVFRRAMSSLLEAAPGFDQVGEAASGAEALALVDELHPDLVLLDARMPGMDGTETAQRLADTHPRLPVVLISVADFPEAEMASGWAGATAFMRKQELSAHTLRELWETIRSSH